MLTAGGVANHGEAPRDRSLSETDSAEYRLMFAEQKAEKKMRLDLLAVFAASCTTLGDADRGCEVVFCRFNHQFELGHCQALGSPTVLDMATVSNGRLKSTKASE
jgi:hypothetical protein